jgi:hypothetical protein
MRPFEGIRIIDATHVLAGPFAAYQLAVLGADVIKVEHPEEPDQTRDGGTDRALNRRGMGTSFLTQSSNKRAITLNLKTPAGCDIFKRLVERADIMVENYRPGAFAELGLGYDAMSGLNPRLISAAPLAGSSHRRTQRLAQRRPSRIRHAAALAAGTPRQAAEVYELINGNFLLSQVFFELARSLFGFDQ